MTTVENLALGIPTMCRMDGDFQVRFTEFWQTDRFPFEHVENGIEILKTIKRYANNLDKLEYRAGEVRKFMEDYWSYENVAKIIVSEYEKLL